MAAAAFLPAPMARITVAAPVTTSPPAYTRGLLVSMVASSTIMPPQRWVERPGVVERISGLGLWPMAIMTVSSSMAKTLSAFSTGLRRPLASGSPSSISTHSMPVTQPFSPVIRTGLTKSLKWMPSSWA
ncbi:hypothetical protein D3C86_1887810 [compost metagenome]